MAGPGDRGQPGDVPPDARRRTSSSPHPRRTYGVARPAERPDSTALSGRSLISMRSQVQVLAGPPTIPPAHGHLGQSSTLPLPARPTGSCQPCATTSGGRVRRTGRRRLDKLVQGGRDGSVPPSHNVLIAERRGRGRARPHQRKSPMTPSPQPRPPVRHRRRRPRPWSRVLVGRPGCHRGAAV
jgi:hypothetical protein